MRRERGREKEKTASNVLLYYCECHRQMCSYFFYVFFFLFFLFRWNNFSLCDSEAFAFRFGNFPLFSDSLLFSIRFLPLFFCSSFCFHSVFFYSPNKCVHCGAQRNTHTHTHTYWICARPKTEPVTTILGGPDLLIEIGSTIK